MGTARGQANQALYLARILLAGWRRDLEAESVPAMTLGSAYLPAVRGHLAQAYGWFLLEITRPGALPASPPASIEALPEIAEGKALPGEIRECRKLERDGWIKDMLHAEPVAPATSSASNLAVSAAVPGPEQVSLWADRLQAMFDRMGDSLDEY